MLKAPALFSQFAPLCSACATTTCAHCAPCATQTVAFRFYINSILFSFFPILVFVLVSSLSLSLSALVSTLLPRTQCLSSISLCLYCTLASQSRDAFKSNCAIIFIDICWVSAFRKLMMTQAQRALDGASGIEIYLEFR